jgi:predicted nucleic acid-binding protein
MNWRKTWQLPDLDRQIIVDTSPFLRSAVDIGEAAVIQIALDRGIQRVAIDDRHGRRVARASGLSVTGSLGILLKAKAAGYPLSLCDAISRMRVRVIWLADAVAAEAIRLAGE